MIIEWKGILIIAAILLADLLIIKAFGERLKPETRRKAFHMTMGIIMLGLPYLFTNMVSVLVLAIIAFVTLYTIKQTKLKKSIGTVLYGVDRKSFGEFFYIISVLLIFYLSKGDKILYSIPILILAFADTSAALIGKIYGMKQLAEETEDKKSLEGSFAFFIVAFMSTLVPLLLFSDVGRSEPLSISLVVGFNIALIEMIASKGNDNLLIPLTAFAFLNYLMPLTQHELSLHLLLISAICVLVFALTRIKQLSKLALAEVVVVGYLTIILYNWYALIPPLLLFLTVMRLPKANKEEENLVYDVRIIETNVVLGLAISVIASITGLKEQIYMTYVTCYAMHLAVNTFVRFKYYFKMTDFQALMMSFLKALGFIFIPGLFIQRFCLNAEIDWILVGTMLVMLFASSLTILFQKKDVKKEEITLKNGYMHLKIVAIYIAIIGIIQFLQTGAFINGI